MPRGTFATTAAVLAGGLYLTAETTPTKPAAPAPAKSVTQKLSPATIISDVTFKGSTLTGWTPSGAAAEGARQTAAPVGVPPGGRGFSRPESLDFNDHAGWTSMFDGKTMNGWDANPAVWKVEDGAITAESTAERRVGSTYVIWRGEELGDFEWKLEFKLGGNIHSGIAYRSWTDPNRAATLGPAAAPLPPLPNTGRTGGAGAAPGGAGAPGGAARGNAGRAGGRGAQPPPDVPSDPKWNLYGPGMDFDNEGTNAGHVEDRGTARRFIGWRGSIVRTEAGKVPRVIGTIGDPDALLKLVRIDDWNQVHIIARGNQLTHIINGQVMAVTIDEDRTFFTPKGWLGWSIEGFGLGRVSVRNLWLKKL